MAKTHLLDGLIKWLRRDEWRDAFEGVLALHLEPACEAFDLDTEDLVSVLDVHHYMNLWGCAFEDFLTRENEDGANIVDDYLKRRGWKESAKTKADMQARRHAVMSLYEVSDIQPDQSFLARDLIRGGEPVRVSERSATHTLKPWDRIGARLLSVGGRIEMGGGVLLFDHEGADELLKVLRGAAKWSTKEIAKVVRELGESVEDDLVSAVMAKATLLTFAAPMFSTIWLHRTLDRVLNQRMPELRNSDGDPLLLTTLHYPIAEGIAAAEIKAVLDGAPMLQPASDSFWNWVGPRSASAATPPKKGDRSLQMRSTMLDSGGVVLGNCELKDTTLVFSANSEARVERGRALLAALLGEKLGEPLSETQTPEQLMAAQPEGAAASDLPELPPEETRALIHEQLDRHYQDILDQPIPSLGNRSPRAAIKTAKGREKVAHWLKYLENQSGRMHAPDDPLGSYDLTWLWRELGVEELRR